MTPRARVVKAPRPRFSVVTIVRNEATRLPRLLSSLAEFRARGGEVVVLDTGSDDETVRVAKEAGCRVSVEPRQFNSRLTASQARRINESFSREGEGPFVRADERLFNFAKARAHAASLARNDFQLAVDGGDVAARLDVERLNGLIHARRIAGFQYEVRVRGPAGWLVELHNRFYDRRVMEWKGGRSHEYVAATSRSGKKTMTLLTRDHLLVNHDTDLEKPRAYQLAGTALEALKEPGSDRWGYFLGRALAARGYFRSALPILLALDRPGVLPAARSAGLCFAAHCVAGSGGPRDEVDALLFRAARRASHRRDPLLRLATRSLDEGDLQAAVSFASAALAIPAEAGFSEPEENHQARPHAILYWALFWLGRRDEAKAHFDICRRLAPASLTYQEHARLFT